MKRLSILFAYMTAVLFTAGIFSCSNLISQTENSSSYNQNSFYGAYIKINVGTSTARTVFPTTEVSLLTDLVLKGTKLGDTETTLGSWESFSSMQSATVAVPTGTWNFTLTAKCGGSTYSGTAEKVITIGENALSFTLSLCDTGTSEGSFSITISYASASQADSVSYAIASLENLDGTMVNGIGQQNLVPESNSVLFAKNGIPVGTYRAKIYFYATKDGTDYEIATYQELVQVASGVSSTATRSLTSLDEVSTVTYELNGGSLADGSTLQETFTRHTSITLPQNLSHTYYTFGGWYTDKNCTAGKEISEITNMAGNITVWAKWIADEYTITYHCNGGTNSKTAVTTYTVEDDVTLVAATLTGKAFANWYESEDFSTERITGWSAGERHTDITLYAKWADANANSIVEKIKSMTESGTIVATGDFYTHSINRFCKINDALKTLASTRPEVLVTLDLSDVTGVSWLNGADSSNSSYSFYGCTNLSGVILPDTVRSIGNYAFGGCINCTVTLGANLVSTSSYLSTALNGCKGIIIKDGVTDISGNSLRGSTTIESVTIPQSVISMDYGAFYGCTLLSAVHYTGDITGWLGIAFSNESANPCCNGAALYIQGELASNVTIPDGVESIGSYAFSGCTLLESVIIPDSIKSIGEYAFNGCSNCTVTLGKNCGYGSSLNGCKAVVIKEGVTSISGYAFSGCTTLKTVTIPESVTSIGEYAFKSCNSLEAVYYNGDLTSWLGISFGNENANPCRNRTALYIQNELVTDLSISADIESIGSYAFCGCTSIESITIGGGIESIGSFAFYYCTSLKNMTIGDGVTSIGISAFSHTGLENVTISGNVERIENNAFESCSSLTSATIGNTVKTIGSGVFYECRLLASVTIGNNVTSIGGYAFYNCSALKSAKLGTGVTSIGERAFYNCSALTNITIPSNVTSIGGYAFMYCTSLASVTIPSGVTSIDICTFSDCTSLSSITIGSNVTSIGNYAFRNCTSLETITIPASITKFITCAFYNCTALVTISFSGTKAQWNAITKGYQWNYKVPATSVICSNGSVSL